MQWTPLPKGSFTGINWALPGATTGFDPYLIWAEADNFAGYGLNKPPKWLPLLVELAPGVSVVQFKAAASTQWLYVPLVYTSSAAPTGLRYCTARVRPAFFKHIQPGGSLHALLNRFELGLPVDHQFNESQDPSQTAPDTLATPLSAQALLPGKVLGLIDGGLAFANANFLRSGKARTRYFWRQDREGVGHEPAAMGYGHELTDVEINKAMKLNTFGGLVDESAVYTHFELWDLQKSISHGTHVMDIACGPRTLLAQTAGAPPHLDAPPSWALADDDASKCPLVAVQLDWANVVDTSGGSMNVSVMDGLMYILSRCTSKAQLAVNISWGTLAGPHDGTSVLEAAMDQLVDLKAGKLQIIVPAGNGYQSRTHANATLSKGEHITLNWCIQPDDATQSFLELWLPQGAEGVTVQITAPGRAPLPALAWGESGMCVDGGGHPVCALIYPSRVATGAHGTCALVTVAPTFSFEDSTTTAPNGAWEVTITNTRAGPVTFDAYIERDDVAIGQHTGARQSRFQDKWYDKSGNPGSFVDHPDNPSPIRRSGSFNSLSTGSKTVNVGGVRMTGSTWAHYSPRKPNPDSTRLQRPGVVIVPDTVAYSDDNPALLGLRAAGTRSGAVVRLVGTSASAPQLTRKLFNAL
jgi:hypothetical protein